MNEKAINSDCSKNEKKKKKGFTLIELLAVVIILGVLMVIAVPSISEYIINSRKNAYISTIDGYQSGVAQKVNSLEYSFQDVDTTYYVHIDNVPLEKGGDSPFGEWVEAYVVVAYTGSNYDYYWTSVDNSGYKVQLKSVEEITIDDIMTDDDKVVSKRRAVGDRSKIVIIDKDGKMIETDAILELTDAEAVECYIYRKLDGGVSIHSYNSSCSKNVIIPATIDGFDVIEIGEYTFENENIISLKIPNTVKTIGAAAFRGNKLTELFLPSSVTTLKERAFSSNLLTDLPDLSNVVNMGQNVFSDNLIPKDKWFVYKQNPDGTYDYTTIMGYLGSEKNLVIPEEVNGVKLTTIGNDSFKRVGLTSIVIPESVTSIGTYAFAYNDLKSVTLPSNLKTLGQSAFEVNQLEYVSIPDTITYMGTLAFNRNYLPDELAFLYARNSDGSIDYSTIIGYGGKNRNVVTIPESKNGVELKVIGASSFSHMSIKKVIIPDSVIEIKNLAFTGNSFEDEDAYIYKRTVSGIDYSVIIGYGGANKNIVIPQFVNDVELKTISDYAFYYSSLKSVVIPDSVTTIGRNAFYNNYLTEVIIPLNVESIGDYAFHKYVTYANYNMLVKIINKTGRSFNWDKITGGIGGNTFDVGTIKHLYGNIEVVNE